jgi:hypothetical protein
MRLSAVVIGRNDNYGGRLNERATYCLNTLLDTFDEVVYVDWNSSGKPLTDEISITVNPERLKVIVVPAAKCQELLGEKYATAQKCCAVYARNIGVRRATGDVIVSTNIDIIPPRREYLDVLLKEHLGPNDLITVTRTDVNIDQLHDFFNQNGKSYQKLRDFMPVFYGVNSIHHKIMSPILEVNKQIFDMAAKQNKAVEAASVICAPGDFQIAHRTTYYTIKGFDEALYKRGCDDTNLQFKVIMAGGTVKGTTFPPVYHINHLRNDEATTPSNDGVVFRENPETWGFSDIDFSLIL